MVEDGVAPSIFGLIERGIARGRVRIEGDRVLGRRLLRLLAV
jgi:hypothetical protein